MDSKHFRTFYDTHFDKIYRFVAIRISDRAVAEDLVSEIFLKALRAFGSYDETRSKSSWIYTIARNHLANHYRSAGRVVTDENIEELPVFGEDFVERAAVAAEVRTMHAALATMPPEKQSLIRMKYLEELSYEEMSQRLAKEKGTIKVATFRAMQELRAALKGKI